MNPKIENFINLLAKYNLNYTDFLNEASQIDEITDIIDIRDIESWQLLGLDIKKNDIGQIVLNTRDRDFNDQEFCVVDIETTGSIKSGRIIEIGALNIKKGIIISKFESFAYAPSVPENITELTGICTKDLENAPKLHIVLEKFRHFLGNRVFVAHNVKFDYDFISKSMEEAGFGMLLNRRLCTIELARKTIPSVKYGLDSLKELLHIHNQHHRAFSDAISCAEILKTSLKRLPWTVQSAEDLITFSKTAKNLKAPTIKSQTN